jgi:hypothetical protein
MNLLELFESKINHIQCSMVGIVPVSGEMCTCTYHRSSLYAWTMEVYYYETPGIIPDKITKISLNYTTME